MRARCTPPPLAYIRFESWLIFLPLLFMPFVFTKGFDFKIEHVREILIYLGDKTIKPITLKCNGVLNIKRHLSSDDVFLLDIDSNENPTPVILGHAWLKKQNNFIDLKINALLLRRACCSTLIIIPRTNADHNTARMVTRMLSKKR